MKNTSEAKGEPESPPKALVDGVVWGDDHKVVKWKSMPEYMALVSTTTTGDEGDDLGDGEGRRRPPRVDLTLSEYWLGGTDSPGSCDFGWFDTPSASAGSIDGLLTSPPGDPFPSPAYPVSGYVGNGFSSAAETAPISPLSVAGCKTSRDAFASREDLSTASNSSAVRAVGSNGNTSNGTSAVRPSQVTPQIPSARAACVRPRQVAANRMLEINRWHSLYPHVSSTGALAPDCEGGGAATTLHLRRTSFPLSTRHFPEQPPERRYTASRVRHSIRSSHGGADAQGKSNGSGGCSADSDCKRRNPIDGSTAVKAPQTNAAHMAGGGEQPRLKKIKAKSYAWAVTEIRVVTGVSPWTPRHAEYLVVACLGQGKLVAAWRRASDFARLARVARSCWMSKACLAWETLEHARRMDGGGPCRLPLVMRPRKLDPVYLQNKARFLEEFLKQFVFEARTKEPLLTFLDTSRRSTVEL